MKTLPTVARPRCVRYMVRSRFRVNFLAKKTHEN